MQSKTQWATIGKIVAPFGVHGQVKVLSLSDVPNRFSQLKTVHLGPDYVPYTITGVRPHTGDTVVLSLATITTPEQANTLRNRDLFIPLHKMAKLPPDFYYQHDILGLQVRTMDEGEVGTITDIMITGSNDVYVITSEQGQQFLIPARKEIIKQIDLIRQMMYIEPIGGMLDDDAVIDDQPTHSHEREEGS